MGVLPYSVSKRFTPSAVASSNLPVVVPVIYPSSIRRFCRFCTLVPMLPVLSTEYFPSVSLSVSPFQPMTALSLGTLTVCTALVANGSSTLAPSPALGSTTSSSCGPQPLSANISAPKTNSIMKSFKDFIISSRHLLPSVSIIRRFRRPTLDRAFAYRVYPDRIVPFPALVYKRIHHFERSFVRRILLLY